MYSQEEIDIMAVNDNKVLLCECKWRNEKVERDVIDTVLARGELFWHPEKYYFIFSKSGFGENTLKYDRQIESEGLVSFEEMCL